MTKNFDDFTGVVPVVIGVTGHRDIPANDVATLQKSVRRELEKFHSLCPSSPLVLLTGLAEGADRLVAKCALDMGWHVVAVLALAQEDFEKDFESEESLLEFRHLIQQCSCSVVVTDKSTGRPECYKDVGVWIARQAQWLLALWDGDESNIRIGGTADVVRLFREGLDGSTITLPDSGPVSHILTRRVMAFDKIAEHEVGRVEHLAPNPLMQGGGRKALRQWQNVLQRMDEFNYLARYAINNHKESIVNSRKFLNGNHEISEELKLPKSSNRASWLFALADCLAKDAQVKRERLFIWMMVCSILAVLMQQIYTGLWGGVYWISAILFFTLLAFTPFFLMEKTGAHRAFRLPAINARYLDCRALAEACRVQYFWKMVGVKECAADFHLVAQRDELEWIRQAVRTTELWERQEACKPELASLKKSLDCWIHDQEKYFLGNANNRSKKIGAAELKQSQSEKLDKWSFSLIALTFFIVVGALFFEICGGYDEYVKYLQLSWGMTLAGSAAIKLYQRTEGHSELARSYIRMGLTMRLAAKALSIEIEKGTDLASAKNIVMEVGVAALDENGDWLMLHRDRPPGPAL